MKKHYFLTTLLLLWTAFANAVPAQPGWRTFTQSDGTTITVEYVGDEWSSATLTRDGLMVTRGADGDFYYYSSLTGRTAVRAHDLKHRTAVETTFIEAQRSQFKFKYKQPERQGFFAPLRASKEEASPCTGNRTIPVILVEYRGSLGIKFKHTREQIQEHLNRVTQYFKDQSNDGFAPTFVALGPYELDHDRSYYGANLNGESGNDQHSYDMLTEGIKYALDDRGSFDGFSTYSQLKDGNTFNCLDAVLIIYAGVGEAQAKETVPESVWPYRSSTYYEDYGGRPLHPSEDLGYDSDGSDPYVYNYAMFCELSGDSDDGTEMDGIGTMCHEFSHCLGLPDFYDTEDQSRHYGMGRWSLMCSGSYNGSNVSTYYPCGNNGDTPIGYSAYEKSFMGWYNFSPIAPGTYCTLPVWNNNNDKAVRVVSGVNSNEYFIYEYRKQQGWDRYIPDEGIMVTHVSYVKDRWTSGQPGFRPNDKDIQLMTIMPADNILSRATENADLWPNGTINELTDDSTPATILYLDDEGTATGNAGLLGKPVTDMVINSDKKSASFWFMKDQNRDLIVNPSKVEFGHVKYGVPKTRTIKLSCMASYPNNNLRLIVSGPNAAQFTLNKYTVPMSSVCSPDGYSVNVTYTPPIFNPSILKQNATLIIKEEDITLKTVSLSASPSVFGDEDGDGKSTISDLAAMIQYMLQEENSPYSDQPYTIDDLVTLINYLLYGETNVDLNDGLVAYYPLDGNAQDMSGNGNHGVVSNVTTTTGIAGDQGGAYRFGGTSNPGYIRVPNSSSLQFSDGFTFSCFVKPMDWTGMNGSGSTVAQGTHCIFAKSSDRTGPAMLFSGDDNGMNVRCSSTGEQCQWGNIGTSDLMSDGDYLNRWVHVAVTYSASKRKARLFVNGNLINERFQITPVDYSLMNASDLYLGRFKNNSWWYPMNGALDEVRIYNRALNTPEILEIASQFVTDAQVSLSPSAVVMAVGEEVRVQIKNGSGNYSIGSCPDIVDCRQEGETIVLTGINDGTTNVTFNDVDNQIHVLLPVTVARKAMTYTAFGVSFTMMPVLGGTFTMGATDEQGTEAADNEKPAHLVTLSSFSIGQTEVTQELWQAAMGTNPSMYTGDLQRPVERVSWEDCQEFISRLNAETGLNFRLPTEAEWEYAARGGVMTQHYKYAGSDVLSEVAWWGFGYDDNNPSGNSGFTTHPVATKKPNELNLYDMSGNVMEWCYDWFGLYGSAALVNPTGIETGTSRISRGGAWGNMANTCRVSYRIGNLPTNRHPALGLRLAL